MRDGITFDDVLLVPAYNHYESRKMVDVSMTDKTGRLSLALPLMTSNMDTVTGAEMANFIGEKGGIGVLHRFLCIEDNVHMFEACTYPTFVSIRCSPQEVERVAA